MLERISRREEFDLFIAWIAISLAFLIVQIVPNGILGPAIPVTPFGALETLGISLVTVGVAFILHEMAHKFTAIKFGFWAEFRKDNNMLLIMAALAALVGMIFAAPGATVIYDTTGRGISREQNGKISIAGPLINLLLCIPFVIIFLIGGGFSAAVSGNLFAKLGLAGIQINAIIAAFNLLPVSILDGRKVWAWNKVVFVVTVIVAFGALLASFSPNTFSNLL
jgi:Zn-dependent protease